MGSLGDRIAAGSRAGPAPGASAGSSRSRPRSAHVRGSLGRLRALPRRCSCRNHRHWRHLDLGPGCDDRSRLALDVSWRRSASLGPWLDRVRRRRGRKRGIDDVEDFQHALRVAEINLLRHVQQREQQRRVHRDDGDDCSTSRAGIEIGPICHAWSTRAKRARCRPDQTRSGPDAGGSSPARIEVKRKVSGWRCSCGRHRDSPFRLCLRSHAAWLDPLPRSRAWHHRSSLALP